MKAKRWDSKRLAEHAHLSESAVSRHRKNPDPPSVESVKKYAQALEVSFDWLVSGEGLPKSLSNSGLEASSVPSLGRAALELVLRNYDWPAEMSVEEMDRIAAVARAEADAPANAGRPESIWRARLGQLASGRGQRRTPYQGSIRSV